MRRKQEEMDLESDNGVTHVKEKYSTGRGTFAGVLSVEDFLAHKQAELWDEIVPQLTNAYFRSPS